MGLPLFVAPVEEDLTAKAAAKSEATSPSRSGIRRQAAPSRDRRARRDARINNAVRHLPSFGDVRLRSASPRDETRDSDIRARARFMLNGELLLAQDLHPRIASDLEDTSTTLREALREISRHGGPARPELDDEIQAMYAQHNESSNAGSRRDFGVRMGPREEREPTSLRSRIDRRQDHRPGEEHSNVDGHTGVTRQAHSPASRPVIPSRGNRRHSPEHRRARISRAAPYVYRFDLGPDGPARLPTSPPGENSTRSRLMRYSQSVINDARNYRMAPSTTQRGSNGNSNRVRRGLNSRRQGVDGLGDRDRSVSPEVWDTLLTTLTPDPQPPSASSSFASAAASQSAGASSNTTPPTVDTADDFMLDAACESGCENSDSEGPDAEGSRQLRLNLQRRDRAAWIERALDGTAERSTLTGEGASHDSLRDQADPTDISALFSAGRAPVGGASDERMAWVGQLFEGASEAEQGAERSLRHELTGHNALTGEDELSGMQRIMRNMARREDIPDEWWAETGLSRTLRRDRVRRDDAV